MTGIAAEGDGSPRIGSGGGSVAAKLPVEGTAAGGAEVGGMTAAGRSGQGGPRETATGEGDSQAGAQMAGEMATGKEDWEETEGAREGNNNSTII